MSHFVSTTTSGYTTTGTTKKSFNISPRKLGLISERKNYQRQSEIQEKRQQDFLGKGTEGFSMNEIYFRVDGEVVPKARPRFRRVVFTDSKTQEKKSGVATYTPKKTLSYEQKVKAAYMVECPFGVAFPTEPLEIVLNVYMAMPKSATKKSKLEMLMHKFPTKKPDADNLLKSVADALNGVAYTDDSQIVSATVRKFWSEQGSAEITLREVTR